LVVGVCFWGAKLIGKLLTKGVYIYILLSLLLKLCYIKKHIVTYSVVHIYICISIYIYIYIQIISYFDIASFLLKGHFHKGHYED
jgi:hypothetical protein